MLKTGHQFNAFLDYVFDMQVDIGDNRIPLMTWSCCQEILWWYLKALLMTALGGCEVWFLHAGSSLSDFFLFISHFASVNEAILWKLLKKNKNKKLNQVEQEQGKKTADCLPIRGYWLLAQVFGKVKGNSKPKKVLIAHGTTYITVF